MLTVTCVRNLCSELVNVTFHNPSFGTRAVNWTDDLLVFSEKKVKIKELSEFRTPNLFNYASSSRYVDRHGSLKDPRSAYGRTKQLYSVLHHGYSQGTRGGGRGPKSWDPWPQDLRGPRIDCQWPPKSVELLTEIRHSLWPHLIFFPKLNQNDRPHRYKGTNSHFIIPFAVFDKKLPHDELCWCELSCSTSLPVNSVTCVNRNAKFPSFSLPVS